MTDAPGLSPHEPATARFEVGSPAVEYRYDDELPRLSPTDQATVNALLPGTALLIVQRGPNAGARFLLDGDETGVGRHPDSEIFLDDVTVSRRHAVFTREADGHRVRDIGSLNGTYVNKRSVEDAALTTGDEVQIGKFRLVYYAGGRSAQ